jgi:hypothetical protein
MNFSGADKRKDFRLLQYYLQQDNAVLQRKPAAFTDGLSGSVSDPQGRSLF